MSRTDSAERGGPITLGILQALVPNQVSYARQIEVANLRAGDEDLP